MLVRCAARVTGRLVGVRRAAPTSRRPLPRSELTGPGVSMIGGGGFSGAALVGAPLRHPMRVLWTCSMVGRALGSASSMRSTRSEMGCGAAPGGSCKCVPFSDRDRRLVEGRVELRQGSGEVFAVDQA